MIWTNMVDEDKFTRIMRCIDHASIEELKDLHEELCNETLTLPIALDIHSLGADGYRLFRDMINICIIKNEKRKSILVTTREELSYNDYQDYKNIEDNYDEDADIFIKWKCKPYWLPKICIPYYEYTFTRSYGHKVRVLMKKAALKNELYSDDMNYILSGEYAELYYLRKTNKELFLECAFA